MFEMFKHETEEQTETRKLQIYHNCIKWGPSFTLDLMIRVHKQGLKTGFFAGTLSTGIILLLLFRLL